MYRIAVITDIHGNAHALHAVLYDLKEKAVDHIYCLGDMIGIGPFGNEVLSTLFKLENISLICFGHDHDIHHFSNGSAIFYNPGSLGCYNRPHARYGIIEIDKNGYRIKQQFVPYDFEGYVNSLKRLDFPRKEIVMAIYEKSEVGM